MLQQTKRSRSAFSLVELVIVVVIIGIIGAIAIPRMSRGADGAKDNALKGNLSVLRSAIEFYAAEHEGVYPTTDIVNQLTQKTSVTGSTSTGDLIYGPYLKEIPALPVGTNKGLATILTAGAPGDAAGGWHYDTTTHDIKANLPDAETDAAGVQYNAY